MTKPMLKDLIEMYGAAAGAAPSYSERLDEKHREALDDLKEVFAEGEQGEDRIPSTDALAKHIHAMLTARISAALAFCATRLSGDDCRALRDVFNGEIGISEACARKAAETMADVFTIEGDAAVVAEVDGHGAHALLDVKGGRRWVPLSEIYANPRC